MATPGLTFRGARGLIRRLGAERALTRTLTGGGLGSVVGAGAGAVDSLRTGEPESLRRKMLAGAIAGGVTGGAIGGFQGRGIRQSGGRAAEVVHGVFSQ